MIEQLHISTTANFFGLRRPLSAHVVAGLFRQLRSNARSPSRNLFRHTCERLGKARWSAISFFYDRSPGFLRPPPARETERICGYILLVEHRRHLAIFKSGLELPSSFKTDRLDRVALGRVETAIAREGAVFEKIRLRNTSPSKLVLRSKMLEAADLSNVVGPAGANRFAPLSYSLRHEEDRYGATPSTGRISQRSDTGGHEAAIGWACRIIDDLIDAAGNASPFIRTFARPISIRTLASPPEPRSFAVNAAAIADLFFEERTHRLVRETSDGWAELSRDEAEGVIALLDEVLPARAADSDWEILDPSGEAPIGRLRLNADSIALRALGRPGLEALFVEHAEYPPGGDPERQKLQKFIDGDDLFLVLFEDPALAYLAGAPYRDDALAAGETALLRYLKAEQGLAAAGSEKGNFVTGQASFDENSVFRIVADRVAASDPVLVCDDLGDEWADFIGLNLQADLPTLSFYHAKHGALSLGASPFHVAVSQGMKNLGRLSLPPEAMPGKIGAWAQVYVGEGVHTAIPRILRGGGAAILAQQFTEARLAPDLVRRVCIVTSSLSRGQVEECLEGIKEGQRPSAHFVQLYWLLLSFFSACSEVGAIGTVICRP